MLQSEFLARQQRRYARAKKNKLGFNQAQLDRFMNRLALATVFFALGLIMAQLHNRMSNPFDYEKCDYMVAAGNLTTAPIPSDRDWNEITLTPGGNWCIATDLND